MSTFTIPLLILNTIIISVNLLVVSAVIYLVYSFARSLIQIIVHHARGHFIRPSQAQSDSSSSISNKPSISSSLKYIDASEEMSFIQNEKLKNEIVQIVKGIKNKS